MAVKQRGMILFCHGARDNRWKEPFLRLQSLLQAGEPDSLVELAYLEKMAPSLGEAIDTMSRQGIGEVLVVPVFLGTGGHTRKDFPAQIEACRKSHPNLLLRDAPAIGEDIAVLQAIADYCRRQFIA